MGLVFRVCGVFAIIVVVVAVLFREHLSRLHRVASLFNEDKIVFNFKTADTWGMPFRTMKRGNAVSPISANENRQLPKTFKAGGKDFPVETWLEKHGSTGLAVLKIAKDGKSARLLHETYWHNHSRNTRCISWSVGKSVVSAAVGVAVDKKLINLEHTVDRYLPQLGTTGYQGVRIKDVLQMVRALKKFFFGDVFLIIQSSGIAFDEDYFSPFSDINMMGYWLALGLNMDDFVARLKRNLEPGKFNHYLSMDTQVLGMLVAAASNQTLSSFIEEHIWSKVGFEHDALFLLDNDRAQRELAFGTILSTTIDFARFGWLITKKITCVFGIHSSFFLKAVSQQRKVF